MHDIAYFLNGLCTLEHQNHGLLYKAWIQLEFISQYNSCGVKANESIHSLNETKTKGIIFSWKQCQYIMQLSLWWGCLGRVLPCPCQVLLQFMNALFYDLSIHHFNATWRLLCGNDGCAFALAASHSLTDFPKFLLLDELWASQGASAKLGLSSTGTGGLTNFPLRLRHLQLL